MLLGVPFQTSITPAVFHLPEVAIIVFVNARRIVGNAETTRGHAKKGYVRVGHKRGFPLTLHP